MSMPHPDHVEDFVGPGAKPDPMLERIAVDGDEVAFRIDGKAKIKVVHKGDRIEARILTHGGRYSDALDIRPRGDNVVEIMPRERVELTARDAALLEELLVSDKDNTGMRQAIKERLLTRLRSMR